MRRVSVIIPSFNAGLYLRKSVNSVRDNTAGVNAEIIVVDDGSTDETSLLVIQELVAESDVEVVRHSKNLGVQIARNTGLKAAGGEYVLCLDGDDLLLPIVEHESFLSEATRVLSENSDVAFVHTMSKMFGDFDGLTISSYPLLEEMVARKHHIFIAIVYRRTEVSRGLHYMENVPKWQDWAFGASLLARRWARGERSDIGFVKGPGHGYRIHSAAGRISRTDVREYDATRLVVEAHAGYFASKLPHVTSEIEDLTAAVVASKPSALVDLLFMASFDLEQALEVARNREYQLVSAAHVSCLGLP